MSEESKPKVIGTDRLVWDLVNEIARPLKEENEQLKAQFADLLEWACMFYGHLKELVDLKAIKDTDGKTSDYEERQPKAWYAARQAISLWDEKSDFGAKLEVRRETRSTGPTWISTYKRLPETECAYKYQIDGRWSYGSGSRTTLEALMDAGRHRVEFFWLDDGNCRTNEAANTDSNVPTIGAFVKWLETDRLFYIDEVRKWLREYDRVEISFSRFVEYFNMKVFSKYAIQHHG